MKVLFAAVSCALLLTAATPGEKLFRGRKPLKASVAGHTDALPKSAVACTNCHNGPQAVGPVLGADTLLNPLPRRGGPSSKYDPGSFCRALRTGVDPAFVVIAREMPRYTISDTDCNHLWNYLTDGKH